MSNDPAISIISVDVGGTFTDVTALYADGRLRVGKVLSTPDDYARGILEGIEAACGAPPYGPHLVIHGTTIATNAVLSRMGLGRAALVTTRGFRDVLAIGRTKRPDLYDISWDKPVPMIPRELIFEIGERIDGAGICIERPDAEALAVLAAELQQAGVHAVAVSLINAYANPENERTVLEALRAAGCANVFAATELTREIQEFERTSTAALNAVLLEPVQNYLTRLGTKLRERGATDLLVMQSNGGLIPAEMAAKRPVVLLESGPAAGVLGAAHLARSMKLDKVIAFDMGGTTAKACLIEGGEPREAAEYEVGGELNMANPLLHGGGYTVRLPCLELCEVGAGGGSIAWIDEAGALRVGPKSAGSNPGPACYGLGGTEPSVADAQILLGYLAGTALGGGTVAVRPDLARDVVGRRLAEKLGVTAEEAALGIYDVANTTMGRAIRAVSVERGRDPADYTLIAFGGSGPIHAAAIARELGIKRVIVPAYAGVFSALAMMTADLRRDGVVSLQVRLDDLDAVVIRAEFAKMEASLRGELAGMGRDISHIKFRRTLDMRYRGQAARVEVAAPDALTRENVAAGFEANYRQLFGHLVPDDQVEIVALRVVATVPGDRPDLFATQAQAVQASPDHRTWFGADGWQKTRVVADRAQMGESMAGPLVLNEANTTVLVPPGCSARLDLFNSILIEVDARKESTAEISSLSLEILRHRFEAIVDEMSAVIPQTARTLIVRESHDFSTSLCTPDGQIVAQGEGILIHLGSVPSAIDAVRKRFGDNVHPGDLFALNDPYEGGSHLPDFFLVAPIFLGDELLGYATVTSHHADVSGGVPGGFAAGARDLFQEGMIIPPVRLKRNGEINDDVWRIITRNTRTPQNVSADLYAVMAACHKAEVEFRKLAGEMGIDAFRRASVAVIDYAERLTRAGLAKLPHGSWTATDYLDDDGNGNLIPLVVDLTIDETGVHTDFSRSAPQMQNSFNANQGTLTSAVYMAFRSVLDARIPDNSGYMRCFDIFAKPGTIVSPLNPAPTSSRGHTAFRLADLMYKVLAQVAPEKVWAAGEGGLSIASMSGKSQGVNWVVLDNIGGGTGGRPGKDAVEGVAPVITNVRNQSIEITERDYPIHIHEYGYLPDTGGAGKWRGANAMHKEYEFLDKSFVFARNDRRRIRPWGLLGGQEGAPSAIYLRRAGEEWKLQPVFFTTDLNPGDRLRLVTAGGGGWGRWEERDPALIDDDKRAGRVTRWPTTQDSKST